MSNYEIIPVSGAGLATVNSIGPDELSIVESFEALEFEFDESVDKASHLDYGVAAGSGLITGLLSIFLGKPLSVEQAAKIGGKEADKIVVNAARSFGCKLPDDKAIFDKDGRCDTEVLSKAIKFLEEKFPIPQDKLTPDYGGGLQHHLRGGCGQKAGPSPVQSRRPVHQRTVHLGSGKNSLEARQALTRHLRLLTHWIRQALARSARLPGCRTRCAHAWVTAVARNISNRTLAVN